MRPGRGRRVAGRGAASREEDENQMSREPPARNGGHGISLLVAPGRQEKEDTEKKACVVSTMRLSELACVRRGGA